MFDKIVYLSDNVAHVTLNKNVPLSFNIMNKHVVFQDQEKCILGEIEDIDEQLVKIRFLGEFNNNSVNSNTNSNSNNNISNNTETPKQDPPINKPSEDLTKIANPNDFFYSITGGNVEFSTNAGCMKAGEDIAFIDVVDVHYFRCYEVTSKANTIMGYYLNIFCENGNCNSRYKSMININDYD